MSNHEHLRQGYAPSRELFEEFLRYVQDQTKTLLIDAKVPLDAITYRVKTWDSIANNLLREPLEIQDVTGIHDFGGMRIVLLYERDLDDVDRIIKDQFEVKGCKTKAEEGPDRFGYRSNHYELRLKDAWIGAPSHQRFKGLRIELQVRTLAQHLWAAISHQLQYKQEQGVPDVLRRRIHGLSALLEIVDRELNQIRDAKNEYRSTLGTRTPAGDDVLDVEILEAVLDRFYDPINKTTSDDHGKLLAELQFEGVSTVFDLIEVLAKTKDHVLEDNTVLIARGPDSSYSDELNQRIKRGLFYSNVGLARGAIWHWKRDRQSKGVG